MARREQIADKRLQRVYGIEPGTYDRMLAEQGGVCAITLQPPKPSKRLAVDHAHSYDRVKIHHLKVKDGWATVSGIAPDGKQYGVSGPSRSKNKIAVKQMLRARSVRGLLSWRVNKGLQYFQDDPAQLRRAAEYLEAFGKRIGGVK
jgi:hypothetical protein